MMMPTTTMTTMVDAVSMMMVIGTTGTTEMMELPMMMDTTTTTTIITTTTTTTKQEAARTWTCARTIKVHVKTTPILDLIYKNTLNAQSSTLEIASVTWDRIAKATEKPSPWVSSVTKIATNSAPAFMICLPTFKSRRTILRPTTRTIAFLAWHRMDTVWRRMTMATGTTPPFLTSAANSMAKLRNVTSTWGTLASMRHRTRRCRKIKFAVSLITSFQTRTMSTVKST
mmetsp:Transcript_6690/g.10452  ORF Transcript_6690/g.10452 Transcript_6690/m.10452 type:complete len:228 (-) Transcript_6690:503-1186(-)